MRIHEPFKRWPIVGLRYWNTPWGSSALWCVRLDDRGDLRVYVWMSSADDAIEEAEEVAHRLGWEVSEDDCAVFPVRAGSDECANVLRSSYYLTRYRTVARAVARNARNTGEVQ